MFRSWNRLALAALALAAGVSSAQADDPSAAAPPGDVITLEKIMSDPDWIGNAPEEPYWADDGRAIFFRQKRTGSEHRDLYRMDLGAEGKAGAPVRVADADLGRTDAHGGVFSRDHRLKLYLREGDVYLKDLQSGELRQITRTADEEKDPRFLLGEKQVSFRRGDNFFAHDLASGLEAQISDLRLQKDPDANDANDAKDEKRGFLHDQQLRLFDVLRENRARKEAEKERAKAEQAADSTRPPLPFFLGEDQKLLDAALAPSGNWLVAVLGKKDADEGKKDKMPDYVTESGYIEEREVRPKVGTGKPETPKLLLLDLRRHETHALDLGVLPGIQDDPLRELRARTPKPKEGAKDKAAKAAQGAVRPVRVDSLLWSEDGSGFVLQAFSADNKDRWIAALDLKEAKLVPLERFTDPAWINWDGNEIGWMRDDRTLWYLSEETGYRHLYLRPAVAGGEKRRLTSGPFEVSTPILSRDGSRFFLTANREHPGVSEAYRLSAAGGALQRLTTLGGTTEFVLSPDEAQMLLRISFASHPSELYIQAAEPEAEALRITHTTSAAFAAIHWTEPEIVPVPSSHLARPIYSRLYTPALWSPSKGGQRGPAVVFVHGAGYLQDAFQGWSYYFHEFMFHSLLNRRGYVVLDMDYRASSGYGRDWRTAIYRQMGHPEIEDLEDGVAWLVKNRAVDPRRVGVYGGSYGGFLTFMALFRKPDLFACGAALRPVSDWAHYNDEYTGAILNRPEIDPEAYNLSSPIEYAAGLKKPLLICHGLEDDNVTVQDTVRLVQRLIELKRTEWFETAIYPVEPHSFKQPSSWLDEYTRILKLLETHLQDPAQCR